MASPAVSNPPTQTESKSAKKKKAKAEAAASGPPTEASSTKVATAESVVNGNEPYESPYLKDLQRNIRNVNKKLSASQKIDAILAENPGKELDELVAAKKINTDQKASVEKKPALQAQLAQLEDQVVQYKKFGQEYEQRFAAEKQDLLNTHKEELEKVRAEALAEHTSTSGQQVQNDLLMLSKFLRAAAAKRVEGDPNTNENRAFEGALLLVYGGDSGAVGAIQKLISGSDEKIPAVDGEIVDYTFAQVKESSLTHHPTAEESYTEDAAQSEHTISAPTGLATPPTETSTQLTSDPTLVNAGMTELDDGPATTNGFGDHHETLTSPPTIPEQSTIDAGAANAIAESSWDKGEELQESGILSASGDGWVDVQAPRDPTETDTGVTATPADVHGSNSWAEEVSVEQTATPATNNADNITGGDDGFHEVVRDHGRGGRGRGHRGEGGYRGERRGRGGEYRGRGGFNRERGDRGGGEHRGRGRGGQGYRGRGRGGGGGATQEAGNQA